MKITAIADTHWLYEDLKIEETDVLIHAGDWEVKSRQEFDRFVQWLEEVPADIKILVAGNHDFYCKNKSGVVERELNSRDIIYLKDQQYILPNGMILPRKIVTSMLNIKKREFMSFLVSSKRKLGQGQ